MFGIGPTELVVILVIALIVFGPKRLPEVGRTVGKSLRELRRASEELKDGLDLGLDEPPTVGSIPPAQPTWESSTPQAQAPESAAGPAVTDPAVTDSPTSPSQEPMAHTEQRRPRREAWQGAGSDSHEEHAQDPAGTPGEAGGGRVG